MTDILFVQSIWFEFLGTMSLTAAAKKAGYKAEVVIGKDREILKAVRDLKPRITAFSCVTGIHNWALNLCERIKNEIDPGIKTLMGGSHPTFFPEVLDRSESLDFICVGEGEGAVIDLPTHLDDPESLEKIPNIHGRSRGVIFRNAVRPLISDLDILPFMERSAFYRYPILRDNPVKRFITGRGCPHSCTFCFNHCAMNL